MNVSRFLLRNRCSNIYHRIKTSTSKRKILFGSTILFGVVAPTLLSDSFSKFALETHAGNKNAKQTFQEKYGKLLKWHNGEPLLYTMIGINIAAFLFWKVNPKFMQRHFLCNLENIQAKRYHVLMTSNWSHMDFWHVGLNMYVLYNFGSIMIKIIGIPSFACIYIGAGLLGSISSVSWHVLSKIPHYSSLGASASLLGIIIAFALHEPDARFKIVFSPDQFSFSAYHGIVGLIVLDTLGILFRWRFLDHAAHLSGALFGYISWNIIKNRNGTETRIDNKKLLCINGQYIFEGQYKDYKNASNIGKIYSPTKTYYGEMLLDDKFSFHGKGCLRNEINGSVFYGYFDNGHIDGIGLLCWNNGKVFPAVYDAKQKEFKIPNLFDPTQLGELINNNISVIPLLEKNDTEINNNDHTKNDDEKNDQSKNQPDNL
eukprot:322176_1